MFLSRTGGVGIGTTDPQFKLHVTSTTLHAGGGRFWAGTYNGTNFDGYAQRTHTGWYENWNWIFGNGSGGVTAPFSAGFNGFIKCQYGMAVNSDSRIKTELEVVNDDTALSIVKNIETYKYHYKDPYRRQNEKTIGFIAQNVKEHLPSAVSIVYEYVLSDIGPVENPIWIDCSYSTIRYEPKTTYTETISYQEGPMLDDSGNQVLDQCGNPDY